MQSHPYQWLSLLPPVAAIALAIITRRVILSLLAGVALGVLITAGGDFGRAVSELLELHLWTALTAPVTLRVFAFTLLMGAMVGVISAAGGMTGLVDVMSRWASNRRRTQLTTWGLGLVVFFDDYANTVLLGNTLRPLTDRQRISREKLAYLVDSTAAPVAGLALISTWVATEIQYVNDGLAQVASPGVTGFELFLESIPHRFYVLWALVFVLLVAWMGRDFGPMLRAERRRMREGDDHRDRSTQTIEGEGPPPRWFNAVAPVVVCVVAVIWLMVRTGRANLEGAEPTLQNIFGNANSYYALVWGSLAGLLTALVMVASQGILRGRALARAAGDGAALMIPALAILWLAGAMSALTGGKPSGEDAARQAERQLAAKAAANALLDATLPLDRRLALNRAAEVLTEAQVAITESVKVLYQAQIPPADIVAALTTRGADQKKVEQGLIAAGVPAESAAAAVRAAKEPAEQNLNERDRYPYRNYRLYTTQYLYGLLGERIEAWLLPTVVFVLSAAVAFATGTSWGTMAILMPLVVPLAYQIAGGSAESVLAGSVGGVLAGAIFGDHCSPISDTTILSSQASGCDHMAHVNTQLPYALLVGGVSILLGTLPVGLGAPVWIMLPLGVAALVGLLMLLGRRAEGEG